MSNSNNWFSFSLPEETRANLHEIALKICADPLEIFGDAAIEFRPMSQHEMHMTLCYCGERMQHMKPNAQRALHEAIAKEMSKVPSQPIPVQFREYALFPPGKNNLVVALFDVSEALLSVFHAIVNACCKARLCERSEYYAAEGDCLFQAHVTMGKLSGLKSLRRMKIPALSASSFLCSGIYLCGKKLGGGGMAWNFSFGSSAGLIELNDSPRKTGKKKQLVSNDEALIGTAESSVEKLPKVNSNRPSDFTSAQVKRELMGNFQLIADLTKNVFGNESYSETATSSTAPFQVGQVQVVSSGWMNSAFLVDLHASESANVTLSGAVANSDDFTNKERQEEGGDQRAKKKRNAVATKRIFIKLNASDFAIEMFESEALGLSRLRETQLFRVPRVFSVGPLVVVLPKPAGNGKQPKSTNNNNKKTKNANKKNHDDSGVDSPPNDSAESKSGAYLVLEYLDLLPANELTDAHYESFARQLARLHTREANEAAFGFSSDNFLNAFRQPNNTVKNFRRNATITTTNNNIDNSNTATDENWLQFFVECRMRPATENLRRAVYGDGGDSHVTLLKQLPRLKLIVDCVPRILMHCSTLLNAGINARPVLLHGDLSNNWGVMRSDSIAEKETEIVLFDCCPFFGHSEYEFASFSLALGHQFFDHYFRFYSEYLESSAPVTADESWVARHNLYQLYHNIALLSIMKNSYFTNLCFANLKKLGLIEDAGSLTPVGNTVHLDVSKLQRLGLSTGLPFGDEKRVNVILVNQGSFAPIHNNHLSTMNTTKHVLEEKYNCRVLGGYFAPSGDAFLREKLAGAQFPLKERCAVIERATRDSDWLMCASDGVKTSELLTRISESVRSAFGWTCLTRASEHRQSESFEYEIVVVCGIDSVADVIRRIPREMKLTVVRRPNFEDEAAELRQLLNGENGAKELPNPKRILHISEWEGPDISSTKIRRCMKTRDYDALKEMMNDASIEYLRENADNLDRKLFTL